MKGVSSAIWLAAARDEDSVVRASLRSMSPVYGYELDPGDETRGCREYLSTICRAATTPVQSTEADRGGAESKVGEGETYLMQRRECVICQGCVYEAS